jgi:CHASE3 domain sensor protein
LNKKTISEGIKMKNIIEKFAIILVWFLLIFIVIALIKYNIIGNTNSVKNTNQQESSQRIKDIGKLIDEALKGYLK